MRRTGDTLGSVVDEVLFEEIEAIGVERGHSRLDALARPARERRLVIRELLHTRPRLLRRRAQDPARPDELSAQASHGLRSAGQDAPEDLEDLVDLRVTREERVALERHLGEDAPDRPHIDCCRIVPAPEQHLRRAVPQRYNLCVIR
jgi:hypothetical protein